MSKKPRRTIPITHWSFVKVMDLENKGKFNFPMPREEFRLLASECQIKMETLKPLVFRLRAALAGETQPNQPELPVAFRSAFEEVYQKPLPGKERLDYPKQVALVQSALTELFRQIQAEPPQTQLALEDLYFRLEKIYLRLGKLLGKS